MSDIPFEFDLSNMTIALVAVQNPEQLPFEFDLSCSANNKFTITSAMIQGVNLSNYATHSELTSAINNLQNNTTLYASQLINDVPFLTSHQSLSNYYTKAEVNAKVTNASVEVTQKLTSGTEIGSVNGIKLYAPNVSVDLSSYYTKTQANSRYVKKTDVTATLSSGTQIGKVGSVTLYAPSGGSNVDLSDYYTKSQCDDRYVRLTDIDSIDTTCTFG